MSNGTKYLSGTELTKAAFSLRFRQLQAELNNTLQRTDAPLESVLAEQDRLILRVEGWVDSLADLHMSVPSDICIFRQTLITNRKVYRMKMLARHDVQLSDVERNDLNHDLNVTIHQIATSKQTHGWATLSGPH
jgi:hypothetical protein